jgi:hypothetical protein
MKYYKSFIAGAAFLAVGTASAGTTTLTEVSAAPIPTIQLQASRNGGVSYGVVAPLEYIVTSTSPAGTFATFCLEPQQHYFGSQSGGFDSADFTKATFDIGRAEALSKLFTGAGWQSWNSSGDAIDGVPAIDRTALGAAVWDIFWDGSFDLSGGQFRLDATDGNSLAAINFANNAYALGTTSMASSLVWLQNERYQDMVIAVPEPSTYALLMAGLVSVGFVARRRRQQGV